MLPLIFRYLFIIFCSLYIYFKINSQKLSYILMFGFSLFLACTISYFSSLLQIKGPSYRILIMLLASYLFIAITTHKKLASVSTLLLSSFGISYAFLFISIAIVSIIFFILYGSSNAFLYIYTDLPTGLIQFTLIFHAMKKQRFKNGIISIIKTKHYNFILIISLGFIIYIAYSSPTREATTLLYRMLISITLIFFSLTLLFYWRHRITQTYREKLRQANEKSMLNEINEHKLTIDKLTADNKRLASIVHADNKLVPAMLTAVTTHLENSDNLTLEELATRGYELSEQLRSMAKDRQGILDSHPQDTALLPKSGLHTVDGMISFMETKAKEYGITYRLTIENNIKETITNALSEEDLLRLLGDVLDNAIIATRNSDKEKAILIHMGTLKSYFLLEISDSGIPFSIESYQRFGNEQHTTHKDSGGSGIGLMDIWKIKKKYKASLHIYEYPNDHGIYTKKISFVFDHKNHFLLQTDRYKEITKELTRGDLYVFPYKSE